MFANSENNSTFWQQNKTPFWTNLKSENILGQLKKTTDITSVPQLLVFMLDTKEKMIFLKMFYFVCLRKQQQEKKTFYRLDEFMNKHDLDWNKCLAKSPHGVVIQGFLGEFKRKIPRSLLSIIFYTQKT